jgi:hypothetical protein
MKENPPPVRRKGVMILHTSGSGNLNIHGRLKKMYLKGNIPPWHRAD